MFLKNSWYVAAFDHELKAEGFQIRTILSEPLLIYRLSDGSVTIMEDRCPHRLVPLSAGCRVRDQIQCGYHGMRFGGDGACTFIPGQDKIPTAARVRNYPAVVRHGHIWVWMGNVEAADPNLIPDFPWPALEGWTPIFGYLKVDANYCLLSDNLLDLSHETYVHEGTIGNGSEQTIADYPLKVTLNNSQVTAHREMLGIDPPPLFAAALGSTKPINRWQTAFWQSPCYNMTHAGAYLADEDPSMARETRVLHLLTPETERSTHYFWSASRNYRQDDTEFSTKFHQGFTATFLEDKLILEQQQQVIEKTSLEVPKLALKVDDAPLRARRVLSRMIGQEQAALGQ